ncbi:MAG: hypothetical protein M3416_01795 [Acidobacteriota bacterium]|nr:hypothetical protein [Acidobacteriota bacterium]
MVEAHVTHVRALGGSSFPGLHPLSDGLHHERDNILESPLKDAIDGRMRNGLDLTEERRIETLVATGETC